MKSIQQIASISGAFEQNLVVWLGNASNGLSKVSAGQLCARKSDGTETCVTGDQLAAVLAAANQSSTGGSSTPPPSESNTTSGPDASTTPPVIQINGDNPAIIQIGATYDDLGATITGPQADLNLGIKTFLNGKLVSNIIIDTTGVATDTIDYVATDSSGLTATSTRTVIVEAATPSITPPPSDTSATTQATSTPQ